MPALIIEFAKGLRVHSGLQLLKRAVRHAIDPLIPDFLGKHVHIVEYDGEVCFHVVGKVHASMKSAFYNSQILFSKTSLLACSCNCASGSQKEDKHVCVHILVKVYQLVLLLHNGLAHHILIELRVRLCGEVILETDDISLQQSIRSLWNATCSEGFSMNDTTDATSLLNHFAMSMEKECPAMGEPRQKDLCLLRSLRYTSPEKRCHKS